MPLLRPYRNALVLALALGIVATLASALQPLVVSSIVDGFRGEVSRIWIGTLIGLLAASSLLTGLRQLILQRTAERFAHETRAKIIDHLYRLDMAEVEGRPRADLVSRVTADVAHTRAILSSGLVEIATSGITIAVSIVMMGIIDPVLLLVTVIVVTGLLAAVVMLGRRTRPAGLSMQHSIGQLAAELSRGLSGLRMIRASRATDREVASAIRHSQDVLGHGRIAASLKAAIQTLTGVAVQLLLIVVVGVGALRVAADAITIGDLSAYMMYLLYLAAPIGMFGSILSLLGEAFGALTRIQEVLKLKTEKDKPETGSTGGPESSTDQMGTAGPDDDSTDAIFRFEAVHFTYPGTNGAGKPENALEGVDFHIPRGATTAIVGPSGAGKSTIFALLERFYEPTSGRILFDGRDVRTVSRDELRSQLSYVEQDAPVLSGTVRQNLTIGNHALSDDACAEALVRVNLAADRDAAVALLDRQVGELGEQLSGGERQRLAVGRAFAVGSPVLLLDEITSNLDSRNEEVVQEVLNASGPDRTIVIIAHRLATVQSADTIVVVDEGHVVAQDTHSRLLRSSELYRGLAERQFLDA
ncbi:hypothetical protein LP52_05060 [Streptomonospora alba]|uniref:ABC transporter n=2 Tax=Streptomonospora alba TaxID=183763 RepID=A0A0C2JLG3_9ACTN|nr:hypothetical protein LP52_05060 [Streptomonospora alba]